MTVKEAVALEYSLRPNVFFMVDMIQDVKFRLSRPDIYDGSILRKLRELRQENPAQFGFKVENQRKSIYRKL